MFYYIYQITNLVNSKIYVGVHKTNDMNDGYMGSGKVILRAIQKHGINNFKKKILETFGDSETMYAREKEVVTEEFLSRNDVYNLRCGGFGGFEYINKNRTFDDWSKLGKMRRKHSPGNKNAVRTPEWNKKISDSKKGKQSFLGKLHTEETKKKISTSMKKYTGIRNSQYGTMWITDGKSNRKIKNTGPIPLGWKKGRHNFINLRP